MWPLSKRTDHDAIADDSSKFSRMARSMSLVALPKKTELTEAENAKGIVMRVTVKMETSLMAVAV